MLEAAVDGHQRCPQGILAQSTCGAGTWERGEAQKRLVGKGGPLLTRRLKVFSHFVSLHQVESFGERDVGKRDAGAAHVGTPYDREGTGAGVERSGGILAEGLWRRDAGAAGGAAGDNRMRGTSASRGRCPGTRRHDGRRHAGASARLFPSFGRRDTIKTTIK